MKKKTIAELKEKVKRKGVEALTANELMDLKKVQKLSQQQSTVGWLSRKQVAELLSCTLGYVDKMTANGRLVRDESGRISLASAFEMVKEKQSKNQSTPQEDRMLYYETKYRKAKSIIATMDMRIKRGEFISRDQVNQNYQLTLSAARNAIMEWITRLPEKFSGMDVRDIAVTLDMEARKVLQDLGAQLMQAKGGTTDDVETASGTDHRPRP